MEPFHRTFLELLGEVMELPRNVQATQSNEELLVKDVNSLFNVMVKDERSHELREWVAMRA